MNDCDVMDTKPLSAIGQVVDSIGQPTMENKSSTCHNCMMQIGEQYMFKIGPQVYHELCVRCVVCGTGLETKCYERNGNIYCHEHYYQECSPYRCVGCKQGISPTDMVYKLRTGIVFHVTCHRCSKCDRQLSPGEQILVDENTKQVSCMLHLYADQDPSCSNFNNLSMENAQNFPETEQQSSSYSIDFPIKRDLDSPSMQFPYYDPSFYSEYVNDDNKFLKRRGPRTTIKQNQLDVLNRIFSSTPKPSKHARAKLALETGLSMRVIQVWFQNRRSKERRLKHLCNYLRHYEQRGMIAPPIQFPPEGLDGSSNVGDESNSFNFLSIETASFDEEELEDEDK